MEEQNLITEKRIKTTTLRAKLRNAAQTKTKLTGYTRVHIMGHHGLGATFKDPEILIAEDNFLFHESLKEWHVSLNLDFVDYVEVQTFKRTKNIYLNIWMKRA